MIGNEMPGIICRLAENKSELAACFSIREKVFVQEQKLFQKTDRDSFDERALHIAALYEGSIIGTVRIYKDDAGVWWGGRLAVVKRFRGRAGRRLVLTAVDIVKGKKARHFRASVQLDNVNFFKNLRWRPVGDAFALQGRKHLIMEADLAE